MSYNIAIFVFFILCMAVAVWCGRASKEDEIKRLKENYIYALNGLVEESFALAANSCLVEGGIVGNDGGTPYCTLEAKIKEYKEAAAHVLNCNDKNCLLCGKATYPSMPKCQPPKNDDGFLESALCTYTSANKERVALSIDVLLKMMKDLPKLPRIYSMSIKMFPNSLLGDNTILVSKDIADAFEEAIRCVSLCKE